MSNQTNKPRPSTDHDRWQAHLRLSLYQFLQMCEALGPLNSFYTGIVLEHEPNDDEKAWHYATHASVDFNSRFGFILDLKTPTEEVIKKLKARGVDELVSWHILNLNQPA